MVRKRDQFWDCAKKDDGKFTCNFCHKTFPGGVSRLKSHLSGIRGGGIDICTKVSEDVRVAAAEAISANPHKRAKAEACSVKTEETLPKMLISKDGVMPDQLLAKFILFNGVDVNIVQRPSFIDFVNAVAKHGSHYKLPRCSVVKKKLVPDLQKEIGEYVANVKKSWVRTGCTVIYDVWTAADAFFIGIFVYSIEGLVLLQVLEIISWPMSCLSDYILYFVTQEVGANNVVQHITLGPEFLFESMPNDNDPYMCKTASVAYKTQHLFKKIYNNILWIRNAFDQARAVVTKIQELDGILSSMKQFTDYVGLQQSSMIKFYSDYYMLQSIMRHEAELRSLVSSSKWLSLGFEKDESGIEVGEIIRSSEFWSEGKEVLRALEPIIRVLYLVDGCGANFGFLYAAMEMADEAIRQIYETNVPKYQTLREIFKHWQDDISHPLYAAAAFLNPVLGITDPRKPDSTLNRTPKTNAEDKPGKNHVSPIVKHTTDSSVPC